MEQRRFSASELVQVIRAKTSYTAMMTKYSLSEKQLDAVFRKLIERGVIGPEELPRRPEVSSKGWTGKIPQTSDRCPPGIADDAFQVWPLLRGAWDRVSVAFVKKLMMLIKENNWEVIERALETQAGFEERMIEGPGRKAFYANLLIKAEAYSSLYPKDVVIEAPKTLREQYGQRCAELWGEQIKTFSQKYPERILHPEIARQLKYLIQGERSSMLQIDSIVERLERITRGNSFKGLSDVQVARAFHADSIRYADENGIGVVQGIGPLDKETCDVCWNLVGVDIDVGAMLKKIDRDLNIRDPDKYLAAWPFPRMQDIGGINRAKLPALMIKNGWLPPWHEKCKHFLAWKYLKEDTEKPKKRRKAGNKKPHGRHSRTKV